jgi:alkylation response protein AidB-like acyl-CoA dehydrogenase
MTSTSTQSSTEEVLAAIDAIGELITARAPVGEANRQVDDEVVDALRAAGALSTFIPSRFGGVDRDVADFLRISRQVGIYDGGTSWVVTLASLGNWMSTFYSGETQDGIRRDKALAAVSAVVAPTAKTERVDGGYRVTGKWYYNSAGWFSDAAILGVPVVDDAGALVDHGLILVPRSDYSIDDTWFTAGMRASASNCVVLEDVFVPDERYISFFGVIGGHFPGADVPGANHVSHADPLALFALGLVGPLLGIGTAAVDYVKSNLTKKIVLTNITRKESPVHLSDLARAATLVDTAHLHAFRAAEVLDSAARERRLLTTLESGRVRADTGWAADCVVQAIDILLSVNGAGSFAESSPLQRMWRDANVAARHGAVTSIQGWQTYGTALANPDGPVVF